jgi:hypothetical protein
MEMSMMKGFKLKTKEEIEAEIKLAEKFVKEHPESMFGDDNRQSVKMFKRIMEMVLSGKDVIEIENFVENIGYNIEFTGHLDRDEDEEEIMHIENEASDFLDWLKGKSDEEHIY